MDKFEYQAKLEELGKLVDTGDFEGAVQIADSIDWKRVRSVRTLCTVSEIYEEVGRVEDSKAILSRAYRRSPNSRQILYRLSEVCVLTQDFDDAVEYYTEYVNLSPNDNSKYILKYKIYKGRGSSIEEQIKVLEDLKAKEYSERWAYELASLYDQAGMVDKCIAECDDLALWFHSGKYVVKALKLKQKYTSLTPEQQTICDNPSEIVDMETMEEVIEKAVPTLNEEIEKELPSTATDVIADSILMNTEKEIAAAITEHKAAEREQEEQVEETTQKRAKKYDSGSFQSELANSVKQLFAGFRGGRKEVAAEEAAVEETTEEVVVEETTEEAAVETEEAEATTQADEAEGVAESEDTVVESEEIVVETEKETAEENTEAEETEIITEETEIITEEAAVTKPPIVTADELLTAATINLGESIRKEIGEASLREYAAAKAAKKAEEEKLTRKLILEEVPVIKEDPVLEIPDVPEIKIPTLDMPDMPDLRVVKEAMNAKEMPEIEELPEIEEEKEEEQAEEIIEDTVAAEEKTEEEVLKETENLVEELESSEEVKIDPMSYTRDGLDAKEVEMLGFWGNVHGVDTQVDNAVTQIMRSALKDKTSSSGNVILVGNAGNGRTTLAIAIAKIVGRCKGYQNAKVAKIYAEDLNNKDIAQVVSKISGGVLIIEEAGDMSDNTIAQLSMAMDFKTDSLVVFIEDEKRYLQELLARNPKFAQKFDITVVVPTLTNEELVEFAKDYALMNEAVLSESGVLTLYEGIGMMQTADQPVALLDIKEIMDKAIKHENKFGIGKILGTLTGKRYDEENRIIINGKSFKKFGK